MKYGPKAGKNPWNATGLEWQIQSPPTTFNFDETPIVTEEAYNYGAAGGNRWLTHCSRGHEPAAEATHLRHHFATPRQQLDASTLGMWMFLITEVLFFGGMFASLCHLSQHVPGRLRQHQPVHERHARRNNTAVLICSSLTMALAVRAAQLSKRRR